MPSFQGTGKNVLRNDDNKDELFQFLGEERASMVTWYKVIVSTLLDSVVSSRDGQNTDGLQTCSREEADTQMLVHVKDTKSVMIRTVDTYIVVLISRVYQTWSNSG